MSAPQIVCPVCHTRQPNAWDCVVCGGSLHDKPRHWQVPVEALEGLETTALATEDPVGVERLEGLEITSLGGGGAPPEGGVPLEGLETTHFDGGDLSFETDLAIDVVMDDDVLPLPGLEPTSFEAETLPTPLLPTVCRYCGTPWREGSIFCGGCGVRVTSLVRSSGEDSDPATTTCRACGTLGQVPGRLCIGCGQKVE